MATKRTKPKLWEIAKKKTGCGVEGKHSARACQRAVQEYKDMGGGYKGKEKEDNSLNKWTKQQWRYSSKKMREKGGRYLPDKVWKQLSSEQKRKTNMNKINSSKKWVPYEDFVEKAFKKAGLDLSKKSKK